MRIVFCSSEVVPFVKTGGLADVCGALPLALERLGAEVTIFLPRYGAISVDGVKVKRRDELVATTTIGNHITVYFIDRPDYFDREGLYGDSHGDYPDNLKRFQFFCEKTLEALVRLDIKADIVHCHDWQTALIPVYLKTRYRGNELFSGSRTVLSIHNLAYQGVFPKLQFSQLGLEPKYFRPEALEFYGQINLLKGGIVFSDAITTVSPQYSREIQTKEQGCGLEGVLRQRQERLAGILNGLDQDLWDPATDKFIRANYSASDAAGKCEDKKDLQRRLRLAARPEVPVLGFVGRLSQQKGIDLLDEALPELAGEDVQMVFLGVGEKKYRDVLKGWAGRYPDKVAVRLAFDEPLAHHIYAGCDVFLMPSIYEPCGLSQMISLRYGAIPLVHKTGGLADTVTPHEPGGNGFVFTKYTKEAFRAAVKDALALYRNRTAFSGLVAKAFTCDFSWANSARKYLELYRLCRGEKAG